MLVYTRKLINIYYIFRFAQKFNVGLVILFYMILYILLTDCIVWFFANNLSGIHWQKLLLYSLFSYPIWMQIGIKGIASEQSGIIESGRWFCVDFLPVKATYVLVLNSIGVTFKSSSMKICIFLFFVAVWHFSSNLLLSFLTILCIFIGCININLINIIGKFWAPKGYSYLISSIIFSFFSLFSGAFFPIGLFFENKYLALMNPAYIAVSFPVEVFVHCVFSEISTKTLVQNSIINILYTLFWTFSLFLFSMFSEEKRRESLYT
jgi:hypothetical protein